MKKWQKETSQQKERGHVQDADQFIQYQKEDAPTVDTVEAVDNMPYKNREQRLTYSKGYYAGYRKATLDHLGAKSLCCIECGSYDNLQLDHIKPLLRKPRSLKDLKNLDNLQIKCRSCNNGKKES